MMKGAARLIHRKSVPCDIYEQTLSLGATRSVKTEYALKEAAVKMFRQPKSGRETALYGAERNERMVVFYAAENVDIDESDQIRVGGRHYDVDNVRKPGTFGGTEPTAHLVIETRQTDYVEEFPDDDDEENGDD